MTEESDRKAQREARSAQIVARMREIMPKALASHPIAAAYVFGSVARGTATPLSDLDIALVTEPIALSSYELFTLELRIQADIEDAAYSMADSADTVKRPEIDVRIINNAPLLVRGRIIQEGALVYDGNHQARVDFEVAVRKRYFDFAPTAEKLQKALLDHVHRKGILHG